MRKDMVEIPRDILIELVNNTKTLIHEYQGKANAEKIIEILEEEAKLGKAYYTGLSSSWTKAFAPEVYVEQENA